MRRRIPGLVFGTALFAVLLVAAASVAGADRGSPQSSVPDTTEVPQLYVNPDTQAARWVRANPDHPLADPIRTRIAEQPTGTWFAGTADDVTDRVDALVSDAAEVNQLPLLVTYNIPNRDCGNFNAGGSADADAYRAWIRAFADGIGDRPAAVVLEPDALLLLDCLDDDAARQRLALLRDAGEVLAQRAPGAVVYLDAGDGRHTDADVIADRLRAAGIDGVRGFALNVSNYNPLALSVVYGRRVIAALGPDSGPARMLIDVSRNGANRPLDWCNPFGQRLGPQPRVGGVDGVDAAVWVKPPGETDGDCGIGRGEGDSGFVPLLAAELLGRG